MNSSGETSEQGAWTTLRTLDYKGEEVRTEIYFEKGWPELVVEATMEISRFTGPLVVFTDSNMNPVIITPDSNIEAAVAVL